MAQVPLRMAQPGLVPPHQQRPPMMVSMTQPPPVSMQGKVTFWFEANYMWRIWLLM